MGSVVNLWWGGSLADEFDHWLAMLEESLGRLHCDGCLKIESEFEVTEVRMPEAMEVYFE